MKPNMLLSVLLAAFLAGCLQPSDEALTRAEKILAEFECPSAATASVGGQRLMAEDKKRAQEFVTRYKEGKHMFSVPIDEIVGNQLAMFQAYCPKR
ncbi:hypothetical protein AB4Z32_26325 [Massilia sp. 2TAF26]|uniref:hypothetical protein n=1 Tax=Massilia sp. 2TAF26 TaxID=3233012 RepID=UPI003F98046F